MQPTYRQRTQAELPGLIRQVSGLMAASDDLQLIGAAARIVGSAVVATRKQASEQEVYACHDRLYQARNEFLGYGRN